MKRVAVLLMSLFLVNSFTMSFGNTFPESLHGLDETQHFRKNVAAEDLIKSRMTNCSVFQRSKSMIHVYNGENRSVSVILGNQTDMKCVKVGSSILVKPFPRVENKIDVNLLNLTELITGGYIQKNQTNVIISLSSKENAERILQQNLLGAHMIYRSRHAYTYMRFFSARLNYSMVFELAKDPRVNYIWLDRKFQACLDQSVRIIKNPTEWARIELSFNRSTDGSGIKIAILDTGIDSNHPDFYFPNSTSKIVGAVSFTGEPVTDGNGHGTHCASIAAGTGAASSGRYVGVAPGAALLNVKVLNNEGEGYESWIISGIQWAVDNGANVLSMSFGAETKSTGQDPLSTVVNWATRQGVVCVVAAGNSGPEMYTIASPGVAKLAITVGASSKTDVVTSFSSRGPTWDNRVKPDVVAPGVNIVAARAAGTSMGTPISQYYTMASGTSMATPHVAGAAALLLEAHPTWRSVEVKRALTNCAVDIGSNIFGQGSGRVDVCTAANASIIGNSSISFGRVNLGAVYKEVIDLQNLADETINIALKAEAWCIKTEVFYPTVLLNVSNFQLQPYATAKIEVKLNTSMSLPSGYFEGRITANFSSGEIRIPFFYCIMSQVKCEVVDENGSSLMASFVLINAETHKMEAYASECAFAQFTLTPGNYIVQAMNVYEWNPLKNPNTEVSFLIHEKFSIGADETKYLRLSLASAYKLNVRSTDVKGSSLYLTLKQLLTPYYHVAYFSDIGAFPTQYLYLTNLTEYISGGPCFFGFMGFPEEDVHWNEMGILTSQVDAYFIGWDLSKFKSSSSPSTLNYVDSDLATFNIRTLLPQLSPVSTLWFNQIAGLWQSGLWYGFQTHPGIDWKIHVLPYHFVSVPSVNWAELEWSCIYTMSNYPEESAEYFLIDRHFQPIMKGENFSYQMGKTPLLPQRVYMDAPYCENGLCIPYYPLCVDEDLFLAKTDRQAVKKVEVFRDGYLILNTTKNWAQDSIQISRFLQSYGYGVYCFVVKTETNLNYSIQNIAKYTINYTSSSKDLIPPAIRKINCEPCFAGNGQVDIQLTDNYEIYNVSLLYSLDDSSWVSTELEDLGNCSFSANLTLPAPAQKISLIVEACDTAGNKIWFDTKPVAVRGLETQIDAGLNNDKITGKLKVLNGSLLQPVYLKVKSSGNCMYTLTDAEGNFEFAVPSTLSFPIEIVMTTMGPYKGSTCVVNKPQVQEVAITRVVPFKTIVSGILFINVTLTNRGDSAETFDLTLFYNATPITTKIITLASGTTNIVTFTWNTSGVPRYRNYTLRAATSFCTFVDGTIIVVYLGDVNADRRVDIKDIASIAKLFGVNYLDACYVANYDLNNDRKLDITDVAIAARNFGHIEM